jgi:hypothetical protein
VIFSKSILCIKIIKKGDHKSPYYRNNSETNFPKKIRTYSYVLNSNYDNSNINNRIHNIPSKERYLVIDKFGIPIFISSKRLLAMELNHI